MCSKKKLKKKVLKKSKDQHTEIILAKSTLTYEKVLETIKQFAGSEFLRTRIEGSFSLKLEILKKKLHICKRQRLDFNDFFASFVNCKETIRKERIWNIFKNYDVNLSLLRQITGIWI